MGLFSANLKTELAKGVTSQGSPDVVVAVDIAMPSQTLKVSSSGAGSAARGAYQDRLVSLAGVDRGITIDSYDVPQIEVKAEIADPDRVFGRETQRYRNSLRRSPVTVRLTSPNVADADSFLALSGLLANWEQPAPPLKWSLSIKGDDKALLGDCPRLTISAVEWPDALPAVLGLPVPLIYGTHSGEGLGVSGMLPAYLVDRTGFRYLACKGWLQSIPRVWHETTQQAPTAYSIERVTVNGIRFTLIDFTASPGDGQVRFDATGYTDDAAGTTGTLITSPEAQLAHFLANFVFNDWRAGAWFASSTVPIDTASFAVVATFAAAFGYKGSMRLGGDQQEIREALSSWAEGWGFFWFPSVAGKVAIGVLDHRPPANIYPSEFIRGDEECLDGSLHPSTIDNIVRTIEGKYIFRSVDSKYSESLRVTALGVVETTKVTVEMPGSAAEI